MADLFHIIEDSFAIVYCAGVYKQSKLYRRGGHIYAAHGGGFIRLMGGNTTSHPKARWQEIETTDKNLVVPASGSYATPKWKVK